MINSIVQMRLKSISDYNIEISLSLLSDGSLCLAFSFINELYKSREYESTICCDKSSPTPYLFFKYHCFCIL